MKCGHHQSLAINSAETGEFLYCDLCDAKSRCRDAEAMEAELRAALAAQPAEPTMDTVLRNAARRSATVIHPGRLAAQPTETQGPVAWRHSKTGRLYDSVEEVPLADGDEWAEPLYATPATQQAPAAWRQWSTKLHDWDYSTNRGDLRSDTAAEPLFLAPAQPADEIEHLRADLVSCRGTVKMELSHYERLAMVHGKTVLAANYEAEAQRLSDLLDRIDAMKDTP